MPKQNLYYIIKIPTDKINRKKKKIDKSVEFNLGDYTQEEARKNRELVAIGDNLVLHKIREFYGDTRSPLEVYDMVQSLYEQRDAIKQQKSSKENSIRIKEIQSQIDEILYVKDIVNVRVSNKKHYEKIALNGFTINGIKYKRLCCGSGQMRRNTVTFVNEDLYEYLVESLMCGLYGRLKSINIAKFSAYFALAFSSILWVSTPRICVVKDFETLVPNQKIDFITVDPETGKKSVEERVMDLNLNSADGQGLISPQFAEVFSRDMDLSYNACQFVVRSSFVKGCLLTFDFVNYAKECGIDTIESMYGEVLNIEDVDVILTESMFKMHKHFNSCQEYVDFHEKYNLRWGVSRYNKKFDDDYSLLNYQYIQNNNLSDQDIDDLIQPTVDWFQKICSGDPLYSTLYSIGCKSELDTFEEILEQCGSVYTKAILQNSKMLNDGFVKKKLLDSLRESFRQAKIGRVWAKGGYQFMLSDPVPLIRSALGLDATGLIPADYVYSAYWNKANPLPEEIDLCRSPMVDRHEHNIVGLSNTSEMQHWYKYLYSGIIYSIYDTGTIRHSDSDFDGDIVFSTDNAQLIKGAYRDNNPITYDKASAPEAELIYENIVKCDVNGFDTLVGQITNKSTSITAMLPNFPEDRYPEQHAELINRLKLLREIIGAEIDKIKLGVAPEFPKDWIERVKINDDDSDEVKAEKFKHNSMVINKKAYFMIYIYDSLMKEYENHIRQVDWQCGNDYGVSFLDLKYKKAKNLNEMKFVRKMDYFSPVLDTPCIMNKLCHKIERVERELLHSSNIHESVLSEFRSSDFDIDEHILMQINELYEEYESGREFMTVKPFLKETFTKDDLFEVLGSLSQESLIEYTKRCYSVISNSSELFEYLMEVACRIESSGRKFNYLFVWGILGEDILDIIPNENSLIFVESKDGEEYLGRKYKLKELDKKEGVFSDNLG